MNLEGREPNSKLKLTPERLKAEADRLFKLTRESLNLIPHGWHPHKPIDSTATLDINPEDDRRTALAKAANNTPYYDFSNGQWHYFSTDHPNKRESSITIQRHFLYPSEDGMRRKWLMETICVSLESLVKPQGIPHIWNSRQKLEDKDNKLVKNVSRSEDSLMTVYEIETFLKEMTKQSPKTTPSST